ncbi:MAG: hypothetical protein M1814_003859 [Vezdaea aestivalis]|nr:MAG: hypothetical protein M1814_003859 [Vezdaea aestivalis]
MSTSFVPSNQQRNLRACMVCAIVQTYQKFLRDGCPNCEEFLKIQGSGDAISVCTSQVFEGLIVKIAKQRSWVAKWQRMDNYAMGTYAVKVVGTLEPDIIQDVEDAGVKYIRRDGSSMDDEGELE